MIRSVRFSLTLWYGVILILILSLFAGVLYTNVRANLFRDIDRLLVSEADGIEDTLTSFWKAELETGSPAVPLRKAAHQSFYEIVVGSGKLHGLVDRWVEMTEELDTVRPVRIISRDGEVLASSPSFSRWEIPVDVQRLGTLGTGKTTYESYRVFDGRRVHLVTRPILEQGHLLYFVQVAISLFQTEASLDRLKAWLLWLIPLTGILTSLVGWFLASLALRPVGKMIHEARQMSESRLHERIQIPKTGDELQELGTTFNEMLDRFERGFRRLRQFSAAASHELRTPLTVMKGEMELALRKARTEEEYERVLRNQLNVVNDMVHIVEQLLAVAHAEDGELAANWEALELGALVRSVSRSYELIASRKGVLLRLFAPVPAPVRGEKSLLEHLIANLLENAIKHSPSEGQVTIETARHGEQCFLVVKDTGKGIVVEDLPVLFEKFFSRQRSPEGISSTGIGLGLCRWIAEVHKGTIEVTSAPGQGAAFTVSLPGFFP